MPSEKYLRKQSVTIWLCGLRCCMSCLLSRDHPVHDRVRGCQAIQFIRLTAWRAKERTEYCTCIADTSKHMMRCVCDWNDIEQNFTVHCVLTVPTHLSLYVPNSRCEWIEFACRKIKRCGEYKRKTINKYDNNKNSKVNFDINNI